MSKEQIKDQAVSGIKWTGSLTVISFILGLIQLAIISRYLSKEEIGLLAIVTVIIGLAKVIADLGFTNGIIHFQNISDQQLNTLFWLNIAASLVVVAGICLLAYPITAFYGEIDLRQLIQVVSIVVFISAFGQMYQTLYLKEMSFRTTSLIDFAQKLGVFIATVILLVVAGLGVWAVVYATIIGSVIFSVIYFSIGSRRFFVPGLAQLNIADCKKFIKFGAYQISERTVGYLSSNVDKLLIGKFFGMDLLGIYELAMVLISRPINIINPIFNNVSFPVFAKIQNEQETLNNWYIKLISVISFITAPIYFGLLAVNKELVVTMFGDKWMATGAVVSILWILGFFRSISNPLGTYIIALGKPDYSLWLSIFSVCVHTALIVIGSYALDFEQAVLLFVVGSIIITVPAEFYLRYRLTRMSVWKYIHAFIKNFVIAGVMGASVYLCKGWLLTMDMSDGVVLIISIGIGVIVYFTLSKIFNANLFSSIQDLILRKKSPAI